MVEATFDAWAAGMIDADGCVFIRRGRQMCGGREACFYQLCVALAQVEETPNAVAPGVAALRDRFGGSINRQHPPARQAINGNPMWRWCVVGASAERALVAVRPYLIVKRAQADLALEYRRLAMGRGKRHLWAGYHERLQRMKTYNGGVK